MSPQDLDRGGFESVIFGHLGQNNLHVNILPRDLAEYQAGRRLYLDWARLAVRIGGTVSAEHGIGKVKRAMLEVMFPPESIDEMRQVKRCFDPDGLLNRGNIFEPDPRAQAS